MKFFVYLAIFLHVVIAAAGVAFTGAFVMMVLAIEPFNGKKDVLDHVLLLAMGLLLAAAVKYWIKGVRMLYRSLGQEKGTR